MTAIAAIEKLLTVNRDAAILILTGIGVFAAISIVGAYGIDYTTAVRVAGYIFGFAVAATVLSIVITDLRIRAVLGWFLVVLCMAWTVALSISILFQPGPLPPVYCLIRFMQDCDDVSEAIALEKSRPVSGVAVPVVVEPSADRSFGDLSVLSNLPGVDLDPSPPVVLANVEPKSPAIPDQKVVVQFAGLLTRDSVREMMLALRAQGWDMQGAEAGGERTGAAAGYNEVRYSGSSKAAAEQLAAELQKVNLTGKPIVAVENASIAADTLEVWLSVV